MEMNFLKTTKYLQNQINLIIEKKFLPLFCWIVSRLQTWQRHTFSYVFAKDLIQFFFESFGKTISFYKY